MQIDVAEYYRKYGPMVLRRCRALLRDEDSAMDAMQEVFVKLLQNRTLVGNFPSSLLYRIATNICLNVIRSEKSRMRVNCEEILLNIASHDDTEDRIAVKDLLDRIFAREHVSTSEIAVMHYVDEMTLEEVAQTAGLSVSGVRKRLRNLKLHVKGLEGMV
jgi:RNA polymerase sigma-70 factor, ECF subfamily